MASLQSNSTCSFKHHLIMTGEAWPASRAILAWYLYIIRTSTIAKNRHVNIVLQAELFRRTGTYAYDRPTNTVPVGTCTGYIVIRLDPSSPEKTPSPGDRRLSTYNLLLLDHDRPPSSSSTTRNFAGVSCFVYRTYVHYS